MDQDLIVYLDLLQQRLSLMEELSASVRGSWQAYVALDLEGIEGATERQNGLCRQLSEIDRKLRALSIPARGAGGAAVSGERLPAAAEASTSPTQRLLNLRQRILTAAQDLEMASRVHAEFLRRGRRTVDALARCLASRQVTYGPPAFLTTRGN